MTIRDAGLYGGTPPTGVSDPETFSRALDEAQAERGVGSPSAEAPESEPELAEEEDEPEWDSQDSNAYQDQAELEEYDPGPEVDDEGGMSEYRHYADWQETDRAEYEREAGQ